MKVAIVSFGHVDVVLSLAKHLGEKVDIDLYLTFALNRRKESILNFENENIYEGLLDRQITEKLLEKNK